MRLEPTHREMRWANRMADAARERDIRGEPEWLRWVRDHLSVVVPVAVATWAVVLRPELVGLSIGGGR